MNFGIKSSFFNGLVFAFSKGPGPRYKESIKMLQQKNLFFCLMFSGVAKWEHEGRNVLKDTLFL